MVPWVGLQFMIMVFPDHTHLLFGNGLVNIKLHRFILFKISDIMALILKLLISLFWMEILFTLHVIVFISHKLSVL